MGDVGKLLQRALSRRAALKTAGAIGVAGAARGGAAVAAQGQIEPTSEPDGAAEGSLTDVPGFLVGHATLEDALTGCTVVLCPRNTVGGVEIRGGWTGTRDMDILSPLSASPSVHGLLFTGGSTFGLAAADGVMRWLEERMPDAVPQVPGAVVYDLGLGAAGRPGVDDGYLACEAATQAFDRGSVGAGTGTRVGAAVPGTKRMKGGIGSASRRFGAAGVVGALAVVNSLGNVVERDGRIVAGAYDPQGRHADAAPHFAAEPGSAGTVPPGRHTTLVAVATNAALTKTRCAIVARMAQAGLARAVQPCFTSADGDVVVVLANGSEAASDDAIGVLAAEAVSEAIRDAVRRATSRAGIADMRTPGVRSPDDPAWFSRDA